MPADQFSGDDARVQAGTVVYKFDIEGSKEINEKLQQYLQRAGELLQNVDRVNSGYKNAGKEGSKAFKRLAMAAGAFFALVLAHGKSSKGLFGLVFSVLGNIVDILSIAFIPIVMTSIRYLTRVATELMGVVSHSGDLKDMFKNLGEIATEAVATGIDILVTVTPQIVMGTAEGISEGLDKVLSGVPAGIRPVFEWLIESALVGFMAHKTLGISMTTGTELGMVAIGAYDVGSMLGGVVGGPIAQGGGAFLKWASDTFNVTPNPDYQKYPEGSNGATSTTMPQVSSQMQHHLQGASGILSSTGSGASGTGGGGVSINTPSVSASYIVRNSNTYVFHGGQVQNTKSTTQVTPNYTAWNKAAADPNTYATGY